MELFGDSCSTPSIISCGNAYRASEFNPSCQFHFPCYWLDFQFVYSDVELACISCQRVRKNRFEPMFYFWWVLNYRFMCRISMRHLIRHVIILSTVILFVIVVGTEANYGALEEFLSEFSNPCLRHETNVWETHVFFLIVSIQV